MRWPMVLRLFSWLCVCVLGGGALAACSSGEQEAMEASDVAPATGKALGNASAGETAIAESARGGEGASGKRLPFEVGEWDVNDPNFRFFDPCTEIPAHVFAAAGLGEMTEEPMLVEGSYSTCRFRISKSDDEVSGDYAMVYSDLVPRKEYEFAGISVISGSDSDGVELIEERDMKGESCSTSMVTDRGRWGVEVFSIGESGMEDGCSEARGIHFKILRNMDHGNA